MVKARSFRFDDDVLARIAEARKVYGTDNAAMRALLGLNGQPRTLVETVQANTKEAMRDLNRPAHV